MSDLPQPTRDRWQPLRGGLMDLYLYEDQQFRYEDGRLLLRGNNGTGKSRVLALQLPFLLDGEIAPARVEPDGDPSKRIEWHLLLGGRYDNRIGYTWLELGRLSEDGPSFRTIGCGMHGVQGRGAPKRWYFITERRIGVDLHLRSDKGTALNASRLKEQLDGRGFFERPEPYRAALDRELFGLGPERYGALIDLLIQLRRPQLSRKLDEELLSRALSEALPPLSTTVLEEVAEAFRGLEGERQALDGYRQARQATERFVRSYREYVQMAFRRGGSVVRQEHSEYESTTRKLREVRDAQVAAQEAIARIAGDIKERQVGLEGAQAEVETLRSDPAMADAARLDRTREAERRAEGHVSGAQNAVESARQELAAREEDAKAAAAAAADTMREVDVARSGCVDRAREAGLPELEQVARTARPDARDVARILKKRREQVEHLQARTDELGRLRGALEDASRERDRCAEQLDRAREQVTEAKNTRTDACHAIAGKLRDWAGGLRVLDGIDPDVIVDALEAWSETGHGPTPIASAVGEAHRRAVALLARQRAGLQTERERCAAELSRLEEERGRLEKGHHEPPAPPPLRDPDGRSHMDGAPLWALCDFRDDVRDADRAGYEAALTAAGLLDAWVTPDGKLLAAGVHDVALLAGNAVDGPSLADVLRPAIDPGDPRAAKVAPAVVNRVLVGISSAPGGHAAWVSSDGCFGLGPLAGAAHKAAAEHVGQGAREQARRRRLAELAVAVDEARSILDGCEQALEQHAERERLAEEERRNAPDEDPLRDAVQRLAAAERHAARSQDASTKAEANVVERTAETARARDRLEADAQELGLSAWLGRLEALRSLLVRVESAFDGLGVRLDAGDRARGQTERSERARASAAGARERAEKTLEDATGEHAARRAERETLERTAGKKIAEVLALLEGARARVGAIEQALAALGEHETQAERALAKAEGKAEELAQGLEGAEARRAVAIASFHETARTGLLPEAHPDLADVDAEGEWSPTRAVEIARRIERLLGDVPSPEAWERSNSAVQGLLSDLQTALLQHELRPSGLHQAGVLVVTVPFRGKELHPAALNGTLVDEVVNRERILNEREREILENHLIGEVSAHLVGLIRAGEQLVDRMNAEMASRPTSTGMRFRFRWEPLPDDAALAPVRKRLMSAHGMWSPEDREAIGRFLQARIQRERDQSETGTWREHLETALDYRAWHRFAIEREQNGHWQRLTKRIYGTGSGGEKAIALTLPLVAAAAAHYKSAAPHAPRFILFDEAFVGIDSDMRSKCMELLTAFDLDFVMTSEREWGCYATLPSLAIYQLATRPGIEAVHATRWVWNGRDRVRDDAGDDLAHAYAAE